MLVTNISPSSISKCIRDRITIYAPEDIESTKTTLISTKLIELWNQGLLKSNCPAIEIHCVRRWLLLDDLFTSNLIPNNMLVLSHDWDELLFTPFTNMSSNINPAILNSALNNDKPFIVSNTKPPVMTALQPSFLYLNREAVSKYIDLILPIALFY